MSFFAQLISKNIALYSNAFGSICWFYLFALAIFLIPMRDICKIDKFERARRPIQKIYVRKWAFLFITRTKDKDWYPKRTIVLELLTYSLFLITLILAACSIFMAVDFAFYLALACLMVNCMYVGGIGSMARRCTFG